ncbi:hypothetical protein ACFXKC_28280 [Streptomyces sp. NPDC059340]|uniref:hypothetical protein n=1 Tax=Streptomyces sp. NPDC059340 TaxID=3346806 RepID=UPI00369432CA
MSRLAARPKVNHVEAAAKLRAQPGEWMLLGEYGSTQSAEGFANSIRTAYVKRGPSPSPYAPAGSFQARTQLTEFGSALWACYVGPTGGAK